MAQIFLARQTGLGSFERHVVLKTIVRERASDQRFVNMFLDEAKLAATLNHQNVAQVYEVDQADGAYFMAMEYVHGENARAILETTIRRGWTIPLELALMVVSGAAAGLHHAHERRGKGGQPLNIVHRDVSPANIMVGFDGSVKVLDFGIAKAEERATKTVGGTIKGKYGYMSPEQCKGKPIDRRSDIFALGIVLYELTTLRRAFKGNDDFDTMKKIVAGDVMLPSVAVPGYPRELESIVLTAMANDANQRFQNAQEMIEALDAFAVREKLTGSNTAMGRYMVQLFGTKKEPWVASTGNEPTAVGGPDLLGDEPDPDNEATIVVPPRNSASSSRIATEMGVTEAPRAPAPADAAAWANDATYVPPQRRSSQRPIAADASSPRHEPLPAALASAAASARLTPPAAMPVAVPPPASRLTPQPAPQPPSRMTPQPPSRMTPQPGGAPLAPDELGDAGAQPLVDDPKLGWETAPANRRIQDELAAGTRLPSEGVDYRLSSNVWWLVLALVIVLGVAAAVVVIVTST